MTENLFLENPVQTMRDAALQFGKAERVEAPGNYPHGVAPLLVSVPEGRKIEDLTAVADLHRDRYRFQPARRKGQALFTDLDSLIAWINRNRGPETAVFATDDMECPTLTAIINYHAEGAPQIAGATDGDGGGWCEATARHCDHRGAYAFPLAREWQAWLEVSGQGLDKDALATFIDDNAKDVLDPGPALLNGDLEQAEEWEKPLIEAARRLEGRFCGHSRLYQLSRSFTVYEASELSVTTNVDTGEARMNFASEHRDAAGAPIAIPNLFVIAIPVFHNGPRYRIPVRFQYRKRGATLTFSLTLYDPESVFDDAFHEALDKVRTETERPVFVGAPETAA